MSGDGDGGSETRHAPPGDLTEFPLPSVYQLFEPGPVALLTTAGRSGPNVMTMSWHMMVDFMPPLLACIVSSGDFSFDALRRTRECVIAIPPADLAREVVEIGNCSGRDTDKFARTGLTPLPAALVGAPLIAQCLASCECRVVDTRLVNRYNLFVLEVVKAWARPDREQSRTLHHRGYGRFTIDGETITLPSAMP